MRFVSFVILTLSTVAFAEKTDPVAKKPVVKDDFADLTNDPLLGKADRIGGTEMKGVVAFTFDDGPDANTTPAVIDACEKYDIPATFFIVTRRIVGKHGAKPREILARMVKGGFQIASHSVTHPNLRTASTKVMSSEIDNSIKVLSKEIARPIAMFRPPFGAIDNRGRGWLKKRGLTEVQWSVDTLDWQAKNAEKLRKKVFKMIVAQEGGVVLMHDVKPITAKIVASVFDDLEAENCARLADKKEPIVPVSIHYFLRDKKQPRAIPADVKKRTDAYRAALPARCAKRPKPVEPPPDAAKAAKPDAAKPDAKPEAAKPAAKPEATKPDSAKPAAKPDPTKPEAAKP
ncbi:MAG TPA: polysaccharide deacetylase family protein [Kofleriaceae bacterium]